MRSWSAPKTGFKTIADLTKHLKEKEGDVFYGGSTNTGIVAAELYKKAIGVDVKRVNYRNGFDAMNEMVERQHRFLFHRCHHRPGSDRGLAPSAARAPLGPKRTKALPDVPTMTRPASRSIRVAGNHAGLHSQPVVDKLTAWMVKVAALPETGEFLTRNGLDPLLGDAATLRAMLIRDTTRWGEWVKLAQIEAQ